MTSFSARDFYTAQGIKDAVNAGKTVYWECLRYIVIKDKIGQWLIQDVYNKSCIGLTWSDGVTLNGSIEDFFIKE